MLLGVSLAASCAPNEEEIYHEAWCLDSTTVTPDAGRGSDFADGGPAISLGDIDGDGYPELAIGHPGFAGGVGAVLVVSARTGAVSRVDRGGDAGGRYGVDLCRLDDLDDDGIAEMAVLEPRFDRSGRVVVVSGARGDVLLDLLELSASGSRSGSTPALVSPGDIDADGVSDLIVVVREEATKASIEEPRRLGDLRLVAVSVGTGRVLYDVPAPRISHVSDAVCTTDVTFDGLAETALGHREGLVLFSSLDGAEISRFTAPPRTTCTLAPLDFAATSTGEARRAYVAVMLTYFDPTSINGFGYVLDAELRVVRESSGPAQVAAQLEGLRTLLLLSDSTWNYFWPWGEPAHLRILDASSGKLLQKI